MCVVSKHDAHFITFFVAASYLAPPSLQHMARLVVCCCIVRLGMLLHDLVPIPLQPGDKLLLDVGEECFWVSIHHVIPIEALSM